VTATDKHTKNVRSLGKSEHCMLRTKNVTMTFLLYWRLVSGLTQKRTLVHKVKISADLNTYI